MKAIIPVAGAGTNLRPLTYTHPKPLIPVAGKPIISFIIEQLAGLGIKDFIFIIGYLGEKIRHYVEETHPELNQEYVVQETRSGSGHAIWTAIDKFKDEDEVFIFFGDTIIDANFKQLIDMPKSCIGVQQVQNPCDFGVVEYDDFGQVTRLVEKPRIPKSNMAMVGFYKIKEVPLLVEALNAKVKNAAEGSIIPLTDALMYMVDKGARIKATPVDNWYDCGKPDVLIETNKTLLQRDGYATFDLPVYENTVFIHPVQVGKDCSIKNSVIGPYVTIGDNATIYSAIIRDSIIGDYASIKEAVLRKSIIGNDTSITGLRQSLNIGDNTEIDFSG